MTRIEFQSILESILGSRNVYFTPPKQMKYPCIKYKYTNPDRKVAENRVYTTRRGYEVTLIDGESDSEIYHRLLNDIRFVPVTTFTSDGLSHFVFTSKI